MQAFFYPLAAGLYKAKNYTKAGLPQTIISANGQKQALEYNHNGWLTSMTIDKQTWHLGYAATGLLKKENKETQRNTDSQSSKENFLNSHYL